MPRAGKRGRGRSEHGGKGKKEKKKRGRRGRFLLVFFSRDSGREVGGSKKAALIRLLFPYCSLLTGIFKKRGVQKEQATGKERKGEKRNAERDKGRHHGFSPFLSNESPVTCPDAGEEKRARGEEGAKKERVQISLTTTTFYYGKRVETSKKGRRREKKGEKGKGTGDFFSVY